MALALCHPGCCTHAQCTGAQTLSWEIRYRDVETEAQELVVVKEGSAPDNVASLPECLTEQLIQSSSNTDEETEATSTLTYPAGEVATGAGVRPAEVAPRKWKGRSRACVCVRACASVVCACASVVCAWEGVTCVHVSTCVSVCLCVHVL